MGACLDVSAGGEQGGDHIRVATKDRVAQYRHPATIRAVGVGTACQQRLNRSLVPIQGAAKKRIIPTAQTDDDELAFHRLGFVPTLEPVVHAKKADGQMGCMACVSS